VSALPRIARLAGSGIGGNIRPPELRIAELLAVQSSRTVVFGDVGGGQLPPEVVAHPRNANASVPVVKLVAAVKEKSGSVVLPKVTAPKLAK